MVGCIDGYYGDGNDCLPCPDQCESCVDKTTCTVCKTGYWGLSCQNDCPLQCSKCTKDGECIFGKFSLRPKLT